MVLFEFTKVKSVLGELGTTNDAKIKHYGEMADNAIMADLINVHNVPNPPVATDNVLTAVELSDIKSFATQYCVGYFYKFESGDEMTIAETVETYQIQY